MKTNIMPSYEELALKLAKCKEENLTLYKAKVRLQNRKTKTVTIENPTGWWFSYWLLLFFNVVVGMFILIEKGIINF